MSVFPAVNIEFRFSLRVCRIVLDSVGVLFWWWTWLFCFYTGCSVAPWGSFSLWTDIFIYFLWFARFVCVHRSQWPSCCHSVCICLMYLVKARLKFEFRSLFVEGNIPVMILQLLCLFFCLAKEEKTFLDICLSVYASLDLWPNNYISQNHQGYI